MKSIERTQRRLLKRRLQMERLDGRQLFAANLFNSNFEQGDTSGWFNFGAEPQITVVNDPGVPVQGSYAALVTNRVAAFQGIARDLSGLQPDQDYVLSVFVRLNPAADPGRIDSLKAQVIVEYNNDPSRTRFVNISTETVGTAEWVELKGGIRLEPGESPSLVQLDISAADPTTSFYVDAFTVQEFDWRKAANDRIEQYRKRDALLKITDRYGNALNATSIEVVQIENEFGFGAALNADELSNTQYTDFFKQNFKWATSENALKWGNTEPTQDVEDYTSGDALAQFVLDNEIHLRGHTLFWGTDGGTPDWVRAPDDSSLLSKTDLQAEVDERIQSLITRYRDVAEQWDVHNEMLDLPFFERELGNGPNGTAFTEYVMNQVNQLDSDAQLFLNEFGIIEGAGHLADEYRALIQTLQAQLAPLGGIGVEAHMERGISSTAIELALQKLTDLDLPIWITEADVVNPDAAGRAADLEVLYRTIFSIPEVMARSCGDSGPDLTGVVRMQRSSIRTGR